MLSKTIMFSGPGVNGPITRWTPAFTATGLTFTGSGATHPAYNSYYVKNGHMVTFWIKIDCATVTNFGTGQLKTELPIMPYTNTMNHFPAWMWVNHTVNPDLAGHIVLQADHMENTKEIDLHWYMATTATPKPIMETVLTGSSPVVMGPSVTIYVNGTYFVEDI